ncbi:unnamed protein product [Schistosoma mattheei]|uniref:Uncharacterized protein n=1 Tax=Schistosoma mattheei TaxID=31246 RepID=A0A3P8L299_9TREM|nr:unnamed protein product [Schistosoma mattheei]
MKYPNLRSLLLLLLSLHQLHISLLLLLPKHQQPEKGLLFHRSLVVWLLKRDLICQMWLALACTA